MGKWFSLWLSLAMAGVIGAADLSQSSIPFADHGGIVDWRVVDEKTVLIESQQRAWYKATLLARCVDLPFAQRIGFESNPDGSFDKFSAIQYRDQRCALISLVKTAAPPKDSKKPSVVAAPPSPTPPR